MVWCSVTYSDNVALALALAVCSEITLCNPVIIIRPLHT